MFFNVLRHLLLIAVVVLPGCATRVPLPAMLSPDSGAAIAAWTRVLDQRVDEQGRVDFAGLARDPADLHHYVGWVSQQGPDSAPGLFRTRQQVLAHYLNAYNAMAMYSVLEAGVPGSLEEYGLIRFFWLREMLIDREAQSLYAYEKRIRELKDARIHFTLNCLSASCPRLPRRPFRAETLDADLDRETRQFFGEPRNLQVDAAREVVRLTEIMRFFTADFLAEAPTLIDYVNRHIDRKIPAGYKIEFIPYDWTVAVQPGGEQAGIVGER